MLPWRKVPSKYHARIIFDLQTSHQFSSRLLAARNITRPQVNFKIPIDNRPFVPFVPKIREKPNSLKPLAVLAEYDDDGNICSYLHPYEFELDKFEAPATQLTVVIPQKPLALEAVPLVYVENDIQLKQLLADLMVAPEIAVDLEHHSYRTFQVRYFPLFV